MNNIEVDKRDTVRLEILNLKKLCEWDLENDNGFIVTDNVPLIKNDRGEKKSKKKNDPFKDDEKGKSKRAEFGIYSPKFGSMWGDENAFIERYSCKCKALMGIMFEGLKCANCDSIVKYQDQNVNYRSWLQLDNEFLIHPILYLHIESIIGKTRLHAILDYDTDKLTYEDNEDEYIHGTGLTKYDNIGMVRFKDNFDEILEFFYKKKKHKLDSYEFLKQHRNCIFTQHIPIFSLILRPIALTDDENFNFSKINSKYRALTTKIFQINRNKYANKSINKALYLNLYKAQDYVNQVCNFIIKELLAGKEGHVRGNLLGARVNFSERSVIIPLSGGYKNNEVILPYLGFLELYKPEIINLLQKIDGITINEALEVWTTASINFNNKVYQIMKYLINNTKGGLYILLNYLAH